MKEIYRLDEAKLPTLITPHDCVIKKIKREDDFLVLVFEDDISSHASIKNTVPCAKSLIIKYHLTDTYKIFSERWNRIMRRSEYIELKNEGTLFNSESAYLYQYVMYNQLILKLWKGRREYVLSLTVDYAEYNWIE